MKVICRVSILLSTLVSSVVHATPAIVWKSSSSPDHDCLYHSQETSARDFLSSVVTANDKDDRSVLFVLDKHPEGKDAVEEMASQLSSLSSLDSLHEIHQHVMGMDTLKNVQKHVKSSGQQSSIVAVSSSLEDFGHKLHVATNAKIHLVELSHHDTDPNDLKNAIVTALEHVNQVVLTGIRGSDEVKTSRSSSNNKNKHQQYRRRLEQEENAYGDDENADLTGVYYVHMTPNIFAGILFVLFFSFISILGISCLGMITNVDVYVSKTPPVGREA